MSVNKASVRDYYDLNPPSGHSPGDIWSDLPTYGLIGANPVFGLVISPACDLLNRKIEMVTYLPVIPIASYFSTMGALPEIRRAIMGQLQLIGAQDMMEWPDGLLPPDDRSLEMAAQRLADSMTGKPSSKYLGAMDRIQAGFRLLKSISAVGVEECSSEDLGLLLGGEWGRIKEKIVTNSWRMDLHFLPADGQPLEWSGVPKHSVVCFRYALSIPTEILDYAQDTSIRGWPELVRRLSASLPCAGAMTERPLKRVALRSHYMADLITRYLAVYLRLGSPDFTSDSVARFSQEIGGPSN